MDFIILLAVVAILVIVLTLHRKFDALHCDFIALHKAVERLQKAQQQQQQAQEPPGAAAPPPIPPPPQHTVTPTAASTPPAVAKPPPPVAPPQPARTLVSTPTSALPPPENPPVREIPEITPSAASAWEEKTTEIMHKIWNWLIVGEEYRNPAVSSEYAVATTWLLRGAILLIVFGIGYFIKYSHENNLVPPEIRLTTAAVSAMAMIGGGCRLLSGKYRLFGLTLTGGGFTGLYMVIYASVGLYRLLPPTVGFGLLAALTAAGTLLALKVNNMSLAILAVAGGYLAPILTSSGGRQLTGLFIYLGILSCGALWIARYRTWRILNYLAYLLCWGIYAAADPYRGDYPALAALGAGAIFFLIFAHLALRFHTANQIKISILELIFTAGNAVVFLALTLPAVFRIWDRERAGWITLGMALFYALQLLWQLKRRSPDRNLLLLLQVLLTLLLAMTIPLLLSSEVLVPAWSLQALGMLWIGCRSGSTFLIKLSYPLFVLAGIRLLGFELSEYYWHDSSAAAFLSRLAAFGTYAATLGAAYRLLIAREKRCARVDKLPPREESQPAQILLWSAILVSFLLLVGEFQLLGRRTDPFYAACGIGLTGAGYLTLVLRLFERYRRRWIIGAADLLLGLLVFYLILTLNFGGSDYRPLFGALRLVQFLSICVILFLSGQRFRRTEAGENALVFLIVALALWFGYSTAELWHLMRAYYPEGAKIAVSLWWGAFALTFLAVGVLRRRKPYRLTGLILFGTTGLKIFLIDLAAAPTPYRIGGCIILGIIMMAGAWLYTRFKERLEIHE